jgi:hypothetical protein
MLRWMLILGLGLMATGCAKTIHEARVFPSSLDTQHNPQATQATIIVGLCERPAVLAPWVERQNVRETQSASRLGVRTTLKVPASGGFISQRDLNTMETKKTSSYS